MTKKQTAIRRIQKLRALAESEQQSGNDRAAESAARMAQRIMLEHAISASEAERAAEDADDPMVKHRTRTGRRLSWLRSLYHGVARANNCTSAYRVNTDQVFFYGRQSDCEIAEYLAGHLAREVQSAADRHMQVCRRRFGCAPPGERNNFCQSAVGALRNRLAAMRRETAQEAIRSHGSAAVTTALVRLDDKLTKAEEFARGFDIGTGRRSRYAHSSAGAAAGESININRGVAGTQTAGSLSD